MKLTQALAAAVTALVLGVPVAGAVPDGYQPQLAPSSQPDGYQPQLRSTNQSTGAATHPDSRAVRFSPAVAEAETSAVGDRGLDVTTALVGATLGAFAAVLAIAGASAIRGRRRLVGVG
jgi:hypothetical protein